MPDTDDTQGGNDSDLTVPDDNTENSGNPTTPITPDIITPDDDMSDNSEENSHDIAADDGDLSSASSQNGEDLSTEDDSSSAEQEQ